MCFRVLAPCLLELAPSLSLGSIYDIFLKENISGHLTENRPVQKLASEIVLSISYWHSPHTDSSQKCKLHVDKSPVGIVPSLLSHQCCYHGRNRAVCTDGTGGKVMAPTLDFMSFGSQLRVPGSLCRKEIHW